MSTITGTAGNDSLVGTAGDDSITGLAGDDTIDGREGNDTLAGGDGEDTISGGIGNDSIDGGGGRGLLSGDAGNDTLVGASGIDSLYGGADDDLLLQSVGTNEIYDGGAGNDTVQIADTASRNSVFRIDLSDGTGSYGKTYKDIENVIGGNKNDTLIGNAGANILEGRDENDILDGGDGLDTLLGGIGNDSLIGGSAASNTYDFLDGGIGDDTLDGGGGSDHLIGGDGNDLIRMNYYYGGISETIEGGEGTDTVQIDDTPAQGFAFNLNLTTGTDNHLRTYTGIENVIGGDKSDTLIGNTSANSLEGRDGNDTLDGGAGADTLLGGTGDDSLLGGTGQDTISGGIGNDYINGGDGRGSLSGDAGNDTLVGEGGIDSLYGGDDDDLLLQSLGLDEVYDGGAGNDTVQIAGTGADGFAFRIDLSTGTGNFGKTYKDIENVIGGIKNDTLIGSEFANILEGREGDDILDGGAGSDQLTGGSGNDQFRVGSGQDIITDFTAGETGSASDSVTTNNDFVDLSSYYSQANYDAAVADGSIDPAVIKNPLAWMRADQNDDGILNDTDAGWSTTNTLTLQNGGAAVAGRDLTFDRTNVMCFAQGTLIATPRGDVRIEDLATGDLVKTLDSGDKEIKWIGSRELSARELADSPQLRPIRIRAGALGNGIPRNDLTVSPQHRVLVDSRVAERMFGQRQVLVSAKSLIGLDGVDVVLPSEGVKYIHFMCDQHEIVLAEGAATETLYSGRQALRTLEPAARQEVLMLFPELIDVSAVPRSARILVNGRRSRNMIERHISNKAPLYQAVCVQ